MKEEEEETKVKDIDKCFSLFVEYGGRVKKNMAERNLMALAPLNSREGCSELLGMSMLNNCGPLALNSYYNK